MGPVETQEGYVLYEVLERRGDRPLSFEQCKARVREDLVRVAVMERLGKFSTE
jgi:parvulin-like peptidyl-prolyl isomerase